MRIRNRPSQLSPFSTPSLPSDIPALQKPSLEKVEAKPGVQDVDLSRRKDEGGAQEGDDQRETSKGSHQRQIDLSRCFLIQRRQVSGSPAHRALDSMVGEGYLEMEDSIKLPVPAPVDKEFTERRGTGGMGACDYMGFLQAWQDRGSRLSAIEKNGGARNGKMEEPLDSEIPSKESGRWEEGEKAFPVKKRNRTQEGLLPVARKTKTKTKPRGNAAGKEQDSAEEEKETAEEDATIDHVVKKSKRGSKTSGGRAKAGVLMEGSRCSRINGRGWRCSQQTLVGYSLCEHHLGKGRLKSMSSLRGRHNAVRSPQKDNVTSSDTSLLSTANDQELLVEAMKGKARKSIGVVKARSISSLLGASAALSGDGSVTGGAEANAAEAGASRTNPGQLTNELV